VCIQLLTQHNGDDAPQDTILVMGDSHLRGCAVKMITSLDTRFDVCGIVKPGSNTESLIETAKSEVGKLTMNDS
jgi:hypothetical protein